MKDGKRKRVKGRETRGGVRERKGIPGVDGVEVRKDAVIDIRGRR